MEPPELSTATVATASTAGVSLLFPGTDIETIKKYKVLQTGATLSSGDRVLVARVSGTYVVLGKIG